jgi:hypothetical protein
MPRMETAMGNEEISKFAAPDEVPEFPMGQGEAVAIGAGYVPRGTGTAKAGLC